MHNPRKPGRERPAHFQVRVAGAVSERWTAWFGDLTLSQSEPGVAPLVTTLSGALSDQAALLGLLQKLDTMGYLLLSVRRTETRE
jgi:hypothetical protein